MVKGDVARPGGRAGPRPLRVPHRRRLPLAALRLRRAARGGAGDDRAARAPGVLLYLSQEGRGIGLLNKLRAYKLQEDGLDTVDANLKLGLPADLRDYGIGAQILVDLGLTSIRILTNNPKKIHGLEGYGLSVAEQVPIQSVPNPHNEDYLRAKRDRLGHTLHHQGLPLDEELIHEEHRSEVEREALGATRPSPRMASPGATERRARSGAERVRDLRRDLLRGPRRAARQRRRSRASPSGGVSAGLGAHLRGPRRLRAAAGGEVVRGVGPLRRRRLPGRRDPRRDRPLRLRLRRGRARDPGRPARDRRSLRLRGDHLRDDGAGAGPRRRRQARPGPQRRRSP